MDGEHTSFIAQKLHLTFIGRNDFEAPLDHQKSKQSPTQKYVNNKQKLVYTQKLMYTQKLAHTHTCTVLRGRVSDSS